MADVQILDPAQYELEEIAHLYMTLAGPESARKLTDKIFEALERLKLFPSYANGMAPDDFSVLFSEVAFRATLLCQPLLIMIVQ